MVYRLLNASVASILIETSKEAIMKKSVQARPLTLDRPPSLNPTRSISLAIAICAAFAAAIYFAIS